MIHENVGLGLGLKKQKFFTNAPFVNVLNNPGACVCDNGFLGDACDLVEGAPPVVDVKPPSICDTGAPRADCGNFVITGVFGDVDTLRCRLTRLDVSELPLQVHNMSNFTIFMSSFKRDHSVR